MLIYKINPMHMTRELQCCLIVCVYRLNRNNHGGVKSWYIASINASRHGFQTTLHPAIINVHKARHYGRFVDSANFVMSASHRAMQYNVMVGFAIVCNASFCDVLNRVTHNESGTMLLCQILSKLPTTMSLTDMVLYKILSRSLIDHVDHIHAGKNPLRYIQWENRV